MIYNIAVNGWKMVEILLKVSLFGKNKIIEKA